MLIHKPSQKNRVGAFTLMEVLIAIFISTIIILAVGEAFTYSARTMTAMGNYIELDRGSRNALDIMSQEIRSAYVLKSFSTNELVFTDMNDKDFSFKYTPLTKQLTFTKSGETKTLLSDCQNLAFKMYKRVPKSGAIAQYDTDNPALCKVVQVDWMCSRDIGTMGKKVNTESVQTAKIVIRN